MEDATNLTRRAGLERFVLNPTNIFDGPDRVMTQAEAAELYRRVIPVTDQIAFVLMRDAEYPGELVARLAWSGQACACWSPKTWPRYSGCCRRA